MRGRVTRFTAALQALLLMATLILPALTSAAVWTDQADYAPGSVVTISGDNSDGAGYLPGETVHVDVLGPNGWNAACDAVADDAGAWSCQITLDSNPDIAVGDYSYTATGLSSGFSEVGSFTDQAQVTINNSDPNAASRPWYSGDPTSITISGTYTCTSGSPGPSCTTANSILVEIRQRDPANNGFSGTAVASTTVSPLSGNAWSAVFSVGSGIAPENLYDVRATLTYNTSSTAISGVSDDHFGIDRVAPNSTITCDGAVCAGAYGADVTVRLAASDSGTSTTMSGVATTLYCVDSANSCVPNTTYPNASGTDVARVAGSTKYVRYHATDKAGNVETIQSQPIAFTQDDEPPSVADTSPAGGAVDVPVGSDIVITFDEDVTVDTTNGITVACPTGTPIAGVISGSGDEWTFNPTGDLPASTACWVTVHSNQVEDVDLNDPPNTMDNPNYEFGFTTASANTPPTVDAGGPYSGNEGSAIAISGTADDLDGDSLTYLWTIDTTGIDAGGSCNIVDPILLATTVTCDDDSGAGSFTLTLTVSGDPDGDVDDTASITVANVAPTVALDDDNASSVTESTSAVTFEYAADDAGDNDVLTPTIDCGANGSYVAGSDDGDSFQCTFLDGGGPTTPATSSDVSISVTDDDGASSDADTQTVDIANADPVVATPSFTSTTICQGSQATLTGISFSDAGTLDDPWSIDIDWGDGSTDYSTIANTQGSQTDVSPTYNIPGTYTATVTVTDKDGGSGSNTSTNTVTVIAHYSISFLQPVDGTLPEDTTETVNLVKLGRVVPVKIRVWDNCANDFAGAYVTDPTTIVRIAAGLAPGAGGTLLDSVEQYADAGQANNNTLLFRWTADASAPGGGFWIYNLDTKNSQMTKFVLGSTYRIDAYVGGFLAAGEDSEYALLKMQK